MEISQLLRHIINYVPLCQENSQLKENPRNKEGNRVRLKKINSLKTRLWKKIKVTKMKYQAHKILKLEWYKGKLNLMYPAYYIMEGAKMRNYKKGSLKNNNNYQLNKFKMGVTQRNNKIICQTKKKKMHFKQSKGELIKLAKIYSNQ